MEVSRERGRERGGEALPDWGLMQGSVLELAKCNQHSSNGELVLRQYQAEVWRQVNNQLERVGLPLREVGCALPARGRCSRWWRIQATSERFIR